MNLILFEKDEITTPLSIRDDRAKHLLRVLHKQLGDSFEAGIINGSAGQCVIREITDAELRFDFIPQGVAYPLQPVRMIIGFPRPIQLRRLLRDIVSLGVDEIHLTATELGDRSYLQSSLLDRGAARKDMIDGCAQAKGTQLPKLQYYESLHDCISCATANTSGKDTRILLDITQNAKPLSQTAIPQLPAIIAIGSERGWTKSERELFAESGFITCSLGTRILRTETACTAAAALTMARANLL